MPGTVRVATLNCEWRKSSSRDATLIRERILDGHPDIVCLTEAYRDFFRDEGHMVEAMPYRSDRHADRRKVLLWSRRRWHDVDRQGSPDLPQGRFVRGTTETPVGELTVMGVCIPYRWAGRREDPPRLLWDMHLDYLRALDRLLPEEPTQTVVAGDFNQRVPRKYQPERILDRLEASLLSRTIIATAGPIPAIGRQAIDHICHSRDLSCDDVRGLSNLGPGGHSISDHFGLQVSLSRTAERGVLVQAGGSLQT